MTRLRARALAQPVTPLLYARGSVLGSSRAAAYIDIGGFVTAVTARGVPMMPNGISVDAAQMPAFPPGGIARFAGDVVVVGETTIELHDALLWSPGVTRNIGGRPEDVNRRARAVLQGCGVDAVAEPSRLVRSLDTAGLSLARDRGGEDVVVAALTAVRGRDLPGLIEASDGLIGRGCGLTPEGDDFLGGIAAALVAFGAAAEWDSPTLRHGLTVRALAHRTTALSATLVELAASGLVVRPLLSVVDLEAPGHQWRPALRRLIPIGHTTGRAWAVGCGAAALMLCCSRKRVLTSPRYARPSHQSFA
jgi:Protein of unknown function (DUF2877)